MHLHVDGRRLLLEADCIYGGYIADNGRENGNYYKLLEFILAYVAITWEFPKIGTPSIDPQNIIILIIGIPQNGTPHFLGSPHAGKNGLELRVQTLNPNHVGKNGKKFRFPARLWIVTPR